VVNNGLGHQLAPAVNHNSAGTYMVVYMCDEFPNQFAICGQAVSSAGSLVGTPFTIYSAPTNSNAPDQTWVTMGKKGAGDDLLIAYTDNRNGSPDLYAELYTLTAPPTPTPTDMATYTATNTPTDTATATATDTFTATFTATFTPTASLMPSPTLPSTPTPPPPPGGVLIIYTYDPLYRLTAADYTNGTYFHYTYDAVGNRLSEVSNAGTMNYSYDIANRLTSVGGVTYTWDNNGNLLSDGVSTYTYDHANRLNSGVQGAATYRFSNYGLGDRLRQTVKGSPRTTAWTLRQASSHWLDEVVAPIGLGHPTSLAAVRVHPPPGETIGTGRVFEDRQSGSLGKSRNDIAGNARFLSHPERGSIGERDAGLGAHGYPAARCIHTARLAEEIRVMIMHPDQICPAHTCRLESESPGIGGDVHVGPNREGDDGLIASVGVGDGGIAASLTGISVDADPDTGHSRGVGAADDVSGKADELGGDEVEAVSFRPPAVLP